VRVPELPAEGAPAGLGQRSGRLRPRARLQDRLQDGPERADGHALLDEPAQHLCQEGRRDLPAHLAHQGRRPRLEVVEQALDLLHPEEEVRVAAERAGDLHQHALERLAHPPQRGRARAMGSRHQRDRPARDGIGGPPRRDADQRQVVGRGEHQELVHRGASLVDRDLVDAQPEARAGKVPAPAHGQGRQLHS
jgi:hypothetical protein